MDFLSLISNNLAVAGTFVTGVIAGNPRTIKRIIGFFSAFFALYRIFIFFRELKNPDFRKFLLRVFSISILLIMLLVILLATYGCAIQPTIGNINGTSYPDLYDGRQSSDLDANVSTNDSITHTADSKYTNTSANDQTSLVDNYLSKFAKLANNIKVKRVKIKRKHHKFENDQKVKFYEQRAAMRKSLIVSCNVRVSSLRLDNLKIAKNAIVLGKSIRKLTKNLGVSKRQLLKLPLNTCERYGLSFLFRLQHKAKKLSAKWLFCQNYATIGLVHKKQRNTLLYTVNILKKQVLKFRNDYKSYSICKTNNKSKYFDKLKMGLFPSRRLND